VVATYAATLAVCVASLAIGQAAIALCGVRRWSWLAPPVGLALLVAACWGSVRIAGDGVGSALLVLALVVASVAYLWGRLEDGGEALRAGWPVALAALLAASLPFAVEGHFGILGTSFNPDMSQHLLAADRLAGGQASQLLNQGYPLGPHAVVVALNKGLGIGLVQAFSGLTVAVAILAPLTALAAFRELPALPRTAGALVVGLAYVVASYFAQGAFKETMQALFLLAFVLALRDADRDPVWRELPLRFVPAALIAVGSVYVYSFPGLIWLGGAAVLWLIACGVAGAGWGSSPAAPSREDEDPSPATGPAGQSAPDLNFDEVTRIWPTVLDKLAETAPALAATFEGARPVALDDEGLKIGFPTDKTFNKRKAESPERREALAQALVAVAGQELRLTYVLLDEESPEPEAPAEASDQVDHDDLVERLKSEFNAEEVS
jgi:hypothetical protein